MVESNPTPSAASEEVQISTAVAPEEEEKLPQGVPKGTPFPEIVASGRVPMPQTLRESYLLGISLKEEGNLYFKQKDYVNAIKKYSKVRAFMRQMMPASEGDADNSAFLNMINKQGDESDKLTAEESKNAVQVMAQSFLNMSLCYFYTEDYRKSIERATESLKL